MVEKRKRGECFIKLKNSKETHMKWARTGAVPDRKKPGRRPTVRTYWRKYWNGFTIMFVNSPTSYIRKASLESGLARTTGHNIVRTIISFKFRKPQYVQVLFLNDYDRQMALSESFLPLNGEWPELFKISFRVMRRFSMLGGSINRHSTTVSIVNFIKFSFFSCITWYLTLV